MFISAGWSTMAVDFILYTILICAGMFENDAWRGTFATFFDGLETTEKSDKLKRAEQVKAVEIQSSTNQTGV